MFHSIVIIPLTLHKVSTILVALASVKNGFESNSDDPSVLGFARPSDLFVTSARAPKPRPAANPPYETSRLILVEGTFLCFEVSLNC